MIVYGRGARIYETLFRIHGSALYKGVLPGVISTVILLILVFTVDEPNYNLNDRWFTHPYPISAMIAAFTFLLTFKCSFSYNRYWEACTSVFQMQSKWLDAGMQLASWHLQSNRYLTIKPPSFGEHPELNSVLRKRKANRVMSPDQLRHMLEQGQHGSTGTSSRGSTTGNGIVKGKQIKEDDEEEASTVINQHHQIKDEKYNNMRPQSFMKRTTTRRGGDKKNHTSSSFWKRASGKQIDFGKSIHAQCSTQGPFFPIGSSFSGGSTRTGFQKATKSSTAKTYHTTIHNHTSNMEQRTPPFYHKQNLSRIVSIANLDGGMEHEEYPSPFLQEASHLLSLLCAVAFTTLRNDLQRAPAPLAEYQVGSPWPPVDPDLDKSNNFYEMNSFWMAMNYLLGNVRTDAQRTVYNSCRPLKVLGGVSDAEIDMLQRARGPVAKTSLCILWLQEFIAREFESGALGKTAPPIVSRVYQVLSDGMLGYNQARKVAYVPFPFPHTQLTTFYIVVIALFMPVLMLTFVSNTIAAAVTNFFTVGVFLGLWHVSTELEDPFRNVPNDLPLNNFQAQFNEALVVMFAGFHPEAWWDIGDNLEGISPSDILHPPSSPSAAAANGDRNSVGSNSSRDDSVGGSYGSKGMDPPSADPTTQQFSHRE